MGIFGVQPAGELDPSRSHCQVPEMQTPDPFELLAKCSAKGVRNNGLLPAAAPRPSLAISLRDRLTTG
jgi:hypothetical protein